jgi:CheY-like chemotaxis protein
MSSKPPPEKPGLANPKLEDIEDPFDLDFTSLLAAQPPPKEPVKPTRAEQREGMIGAERLGKDGFHIVVARKREAPPRNNVILVVDDDPPTAELAAHVLRKAGFQAVVEGTPRDAARHMARLGVPALVLLDVELPQMSGFDFLERMRGHKHVKDVPVILFTVHNERSDVIRGLKAGADGYIAKPITPSALVNAVKTVLGQ